MFTSLLFSRTRRVAVLAIAASAPATLGIVGFFAVESRAAAVLVLVLGLLLAVVMVVGLKLAMEARSAGLGLEAGAVRTGESMARLEESQQQMSAEQASLEQRLRDANASLENRLAEARADADRLRTELGGAQDSVQELAVQMKRALDELFDGAQERAGQMKALQEEIENRQAAERQTARRLEALSSEVRRVEEKLTRLNNRHSDLLKGFDSTRSTTALAMARQLSSKRYPQRVMLQITMHRSASTRLFDILRSHPNAYVEPLSFIWEALGLDGRRYPTALFDGSEATLPLEVQPGMGAMIRSVKVPPLHQDPVEGRVAIEKAHPQFFRFDAAWFHDRLAEAKTVHGFDVDLVFQVREPLDVMWSMAEYKLRDPTWYRHLDVGEIPGFVHKSLDALAQLHQLEAGLVIDFADLDPTNPNMRSLALALDSRMDEAEMDAWLTHAFEQTSLDRLRETGTTFVGARNDAREPVGPDRAWESEQSVIEACHDLYTQLTAGSGRT